MTQECKTCKWLDVAPDKAGRRVVRIGCGYMCAAPNPEAPLLPESVTQDHNWRWPPHRGRVTALSGKDCPCYVRRETT